MAKQNESVNKILSDIQSLRSFLKSDVSINNAEEKEAVVTIKVYNDAPESRDGGNIVFLGVGLRFIDGRGTPRGSNYWPSRASKSRPSDQEALRRQYNEGIWVGSTEAFPVVTSDEQAHGEVLFPGEVVVYAIKTTNADLPYLDIRVEGSVSRRHLLHISNTVSALKSLSLPIVAKVFQDIDKLDLYSPLITLRDAIPVLDPNTRLADLEAYKGKLEEAINHVKKVMPELNTVYHAAPNQELRDLMKQHIGNYLTTSERLSNKVLQTISGSDTKLMMESTEELKAHLLTLDKINKVKVNSMTKFGINPQ